MIKIKRDHVKLASTFVVGRAVQGVISTIIHQHTTPETKLQAAQAHIAAYAIGSMVADAAKDHTDKKIDELAELIAEVKNGTVALTAKK